MLARSWSQGQKTPQTTANDPVAGKSNLAEKQEGGYEPASNVRLRRRTRAKGGMAKAGLSHRGYDNTAP